MKKILLLVFVICLTALIAGQAAAETITMAANEWPPYYSEKMDGKGVAGLIIAEALKRSGHEVTFMFIPWKRALREVEEGKIDAVSTAYYTEERSKIYAYSDKYMQGIEGFFKLKSKDVKYNDLAELKPYKIGVMRGYALPEKFAATEGLTKLEADTEKQLLEMLVRERIDLALVDKYVGLSILNSEMAADKDKVEFMTPELSANDIHVMFSRKKEGYEKLVEDFNKGLKEMIADGAYDKIMSDAGLK